MFCVKKQTNNPMYLLIPSIVLLIFARIILSTNYLDDKLPFKSYFINMNEFSNELDSVAENHPVLFTSKYHYLSIYSFAKNKLVPGSPHYNKRFSQVDLNMIDSIYNGKRIFALNFGDEKVWTSNTHLKLREKFMSIFSMLGLKYPTLKITPQLLILLNFLVDIHQYPLKLQHNKPTIVLEHNTILVRQIPQRQELLVSLSLNL